MTGVAHPLTRLLPPDPTEIRTAVAWVLHSVPPQFDRHRLNFGLTEAITNALIHGLLELRLPADRDPAELSQVTRARSKDPSFLNRRIRLDCSYTVERLTLTLSWVGASYRPGNLVAPRESEPALAGRGMTVIHDCFDDVRWAEGGKSVTFVLNATP